MKPILQAIRTSIAPTYMSGSSKKISSATTVGTVSEHPLHFNNQVSVLYVEDNVINQTIGSKVLKNLGCTCEIAHSGLQALEMLAMKSYDLVLMDINMPLLDGLQTTRQIRQHLQLQVPIVAVTTNVMEEDIQACLDAGMNAHLGKPYSQHQLSILIYQWCHTKMAKY